MKSCCHGEQCSACRIIVPHDSLSDHLLDDAGANHMKTPRIRCPNLSRVVEIEFDLNLVVQSVLSVEHNISFPSQYDLGHMIRSISYLS